jgi:hypothetical protein
MTTIIIDEKTKEAKALLEYLAKLKYVKIQTDKSPYDPVFVKKVKEAEKRGNYITIKDAKNVWESIL